MRPSSRAVVAVVALTLAACGGGDTSVTSTSTTSPISLPPATSTTITSTTIIGEELPTDSPVVEAAIAVLAEHLSIPTDAIEVVSAREVTWPDGALGCPQPGEMYTQALVEGYQVVLGANERVYVFHAGSDGEPFLCPSEDKDGGYDFVPPPGDR